MTKKVIVGYNTPFLFSRSMLNFFSDGEYAAQQERESRVRLKSGTCHARLIGPVAWGLLVALCVMQAPSLLGQQRGEATALPPGSGKELLAVACTQCHNLRPILIWRDGRPGWKKEVELMVLRGARITPEEADTIIQYLSQNFGPGVRGVPSGESTGTTTAPAEKPISLPPGPGKELVESRCTVCHDLGRVTTVKRTPQEWEQTTKDMINRGGQATAEEIQSITSYLTTQFGK